MVVPKLLSPPLDEGTGGDGLPTPFDMASRRPEFLEWIKGFSWEADWGPGMRAVLNYCKSQVTLTRKNKHRLRWCSCCTSEGGGREFVSV